MSENYCFKMQRWAARTPSHDVCWGQLSASWWKKVGFVQQQAFNVQQPVRLLTDAVCCVLALTIWPLVQPLSEHPVVQDLLSGYISFITSISSLFCGWWKKEPFFFWGTIIWMFLYVMECSIHCIHQTMLTIIVELKCMYVLSFVKALGSSELYHLTQYWLQVWKVKTCWVGSLLIFL